MSTKKLIKALGLIIVVALLAAMLHHAPLHHAKASFCMGREHVRARLLRRAKNALFAMTKGG